MTEDDVSDPALLGGTIRADHVTYSVVGIAEPAFRGVEGSLGVDVWVPLPGTSTGGTSVPPN